MHIKLFQGFSILRVTARDGDRGVGEPNNIVYSFTDGKLFVCVFTHIFLHSTIVCDIKVNKDLL